MDRKTFTLSIVLCLAASALMCGCGNGDTNDRHPTKQEGAAADTKRQAYIDSLNIPADQKARMKAQLGGPPVQNPADQAKAGAGAAQSGDRK